MEVEILSPDKIITKQKIKSIKLPGKLSSFTVLYNHAPIISILEKGTIVLTLNDNTKKVIEVNGGIVEVKKNKISVLLT